MPLPNEAFGKDPADDFDTSLVSGEVHVLIVYTITIFMSATLLFLVQPMFARMLQPARPAMDLLRD